MAAILPVPSVATDADRPVARGADELHDEPNQQSEIEPIVVEADERPGFLEDCTFSIKPRTCYLDRSRDSGNDNVGWALGGSLGCQSGWWLDRVRPDGTVYASQVS